MRMLTPTVAASSRRRGFTLVEMLIAITIFAILATIAIGSFSEIGGDRVPAAARQLRGMIAGAQSRAAKDRAARGLRLIIDPQLSTFPDSVYVTSLVYVGANTDVAGNLRDNDRTIAATAFHPQRTVKLVPNGLGWEMRQDNNETILWSDLRTNRNARPGDRVYLQWPSLPPRGRFDPPIDDQLTFQERIFYINSIYERSNGSVNETYIRVSGPEPPLSLDGIIRYRLELAPEVLPNSEPVTLPRGTVIDLNASKIPDAVLSTIGTGTGQNLFIDILFTPRGEIQGAMAGEGMVHFYVGELGDSQNDRVVAASESTRVIDGNADSQVTGPQRIVSLIPATGQVIATEYIQSTMGQVRFGQSILGREAK